LATKSTIKGEKELWKGEGEVLEEKVENHLRVSNVA